ncbi:MFS transporter [Rugosimonospora africana]|uniref:MFS transporter n=1 Tax=Rugosimonospora africana TaxID=556532 RepID=A0A8J3VSL9_9ACTN|nr:MFS transporter [Rugosimonospora africana]GIH17442.1 MFS transporter [Rugosimonospora africana]
MTTTVGSAAAETAAPPRRPAYREPGYLRYIGGQAVSTLGDQVWYVALSWSAVRLASPGLAGVILAVSSVPRLILLLFGGAIVDRYGPRRLMIGSDLVRAAVSLAAAAIALARPGIALLVVVALVFGIADAVFLPAAGALAPRLLRPDQLTGGAALNTLVARIALTIGAPLGGLLVALGGLSLASAVNAATFIVSVAALSGLRPRETAAAVREPIGRSLRDGLRYLGRHPLLRALLAVSLLANLGFVGPMNVGLAVVADRHGWGAGGIGLMLAGFGLGAAASALLMTRLTVRSGPMMAVCAAVQGAAVFAVVLAPVPAVAAAVTAVAGITSGPLAVLISSLSQRHTDDAYRGRVSSVQTLANLGITPLAVAVMGAAVGWLGIVPAFGASASLELAAAVICLAVPSLRTAARH